MESVSALVFIGAVVIGVTEFLKRFHTKDYMGAIIIATAALVGGLVGFFDVSLGVTNISVAQGIMAGFGAVGVHTTAKQVG